MNAGRTTSVFLVVAAFLGIATYGIKQRVMVLEDSLIKTNKRTVALQESTHLLNAELSYLTAPKRLQSLASKHLKFMPVTGHQMVAPETLESLILTQQQQLNIAGLKNDQ